MSKIELFANDLRDVPATVSFLADGTLAVRPYYLSDAEHVVEAAWRAGLDVEVLSAERAVVVSGFEEAA